MSNTPVISFKLKLNLHTSIPSWLLPPIAILPLHKIKSKTRASVQILMDLTRRLHHVLNESPPASDVVFQENFFIFRQAQFEGVQHLLKAESLLFWRHGTSHGSLRGSTAETSTKTSEWKSTLGLKSVLRRNIDNLSLVTRTKSSEWKENHAFSPVRLQAATGFSCSKSDSTAQTRAGWDRKLARLPSH